MTLHDWQQLSPAEAVRSLARGLDRLPAGQRAALVAAAPDENELANRFAAARGPLARAPYFLKDLFDVAGVPTRAGSSFLAEVRPVPARDGALVRTLTAAGAVYAGKAQLHEFAYGITGENPHSGDAQHPRFPDRTTGGSSSGSAALVAAGVVPFAIGSDTGGSVRVPAAFCGLYGFRLTPADAFIADAFPLAPSFDTAGWFTGTAGDLATVTAALTGLRRSDRAPRGCYLEMPDVDPEIAQACRQTAANLAPVADAATRAELLAGFAPTLEAYNAIVAVEAWAVHRDWAERYRSRYGATVWERLNRAHQVTVEQVKSARATVEAVRLLWRNFFLTYDFLVLPAAPCVAPTKAECTLETRRRVLALTAPASLGGLPAVTIPIPLASGLSAGLQVIVNEVQSPVIDWVLRR